MKKWMRTVLCIAVLLTMLAAMPAAFAAQPEESGNILGHDYVNVDRWAMPAYSALDYDEDTQIYTRVEYTGEYVRVERYDSGLNYLDGRNIEMELPIYGGFHSAEDHYFLIFGQTNPEEKDDAEVIRVVKFDKSWNRLGQASLKGANTTVPFDAGAVSAAAYNGYLYLRTSHEMYMTNDGLNHQANLTMNVRISDMTITDAFYTVMNSKYGYVSHSFNQFIAIDEENKTIVALDHGDAYPRSVVLTKYYATAGQDRFSDPIQVPAPEYGSGYYTFAAADTADVLPIMGQIGANDTGVSVGGMEIAGSTYVTVGTSVVQDESSYDPIGQRNVYLTVTQKDLSATDVIWLTDFGQDQDVQISNPYLVKINADRFLIIWSTYDDGARMHHVFVDGEGNLLTEIFTQSCEKASLLSDCQPILACDRVIWYMTDGSAPAFYTIDASNGSVIESQAPGDSEEQEPTTPGDEPQQPTTPDDEPQQPTTPDDEPQEPTTPGDEPQEPTIPDEEQDPANPFTDVEKGKFYYDAVLWAVEQDITKGVDDTHFGPMTGCSRGHVVTFLWRAAGCPEPASGDNPFTDVAEGKFYYTAVLWAVEKGITKGTTATTFEPGKTCTRGQIVTFLWRYMGQPRPEGTGESFTDVKQDAFYTDAVAWAVEAGVTNGIGGGKFGPGDTCTRGQVVTFLQRCVG